MESEINFYNEIFVNEQKWQELIDRNLLNSIYCKLTLKPFYIEKRQKIENMYNRTQNEILNGFLQKIDDIIEKVDEFDKKYEDLKPLDISELKPLLLINQIGYNSKSIEDDKASTHVYR